MFVEALGAFREDERVLLSVVLESEMGRSFVAVLDASPFEEIGRATGPHHIPHGSHGAYYGGMVAGNSAQMRLGDSYFSPTGVQSAIEASQGQVVSIVHYEARWPSAGLPTGMTLATTRSGQ